MKQMRRAVSIALVLTMILSMFTINFMTANAADTAAPLLGDVDGDGKITIFDASAIQKSVAGIAGSINYRAMEEAGETDRIEHIIADVDKDGKITIFDASLIQRYVSGGPAYKEASPIGKPITTPEPPTDEPTQAPVTDEPTQAPVTDEPTQAPVTDEPTQAPDTESGELVDGYYMVGTLNGENCWAENITSDRMFKENPGAAGEYMLDWYFYDGDEIKAVKVENGEVTAWYNPDGENYKLTAEGGKTGNCRVYFNPDGNDTWSYNYLTVQPGSGPTPTTDVPTSSGELADGYYMVGTLNGKNCWQDNITSDRMFKANPGADGEYMLDWTFYDGDEIKAVKVENGAVTAWYNSDGDNYKLTAEGGKTGACTVYFNPKGNAAWSYTYLTVQPKTGPTPTTSDETTAPVTSSGDLADGYYMVGTLNGKNCWQDNITSDRLFKANPGADGEYMLDWTFYDGDEIKAVKVENGEVTAWYPDGGKNYKLTDEGNKTGDCTVYFNPNGNPNGPIPI